MPACRRPFWPEGAWNVIGSSKRRAPLSGTRPPAAPRPSRFEPFARRDGSDGAIARHADLRYFGRRTTEAWRLTKRGRATALYRLEHLWNRYGSAAVAMLKGAETAAALDRVKQHQAQIKAVAG